MKEEDLINLSTDELKEKEKSDRTNAFILAGLVLILLAFSIYDLIKTKEFSTMLVIAIALSAVVLSKYRGIRIMRKELNRR